MKYKNLNLKYALINASFMFMVVASAGYSYNFLSQSGFADGTIGLIITSISLCGLIGQPIAGSLVDKSDKIDEKKFISCAMIVTIILSILLALVPNGSFLMILVTVLCFFSASVSLPLFNSMAFIYEKDGQKINYGLGRGIGSAAYAVGSSLLGQLWGWMGKAVLPWYITTFAALSFLLLQLMPTPSAAAEKAGEAEDAAKRQDLSYAAFFRKYNKALIIVLSLIMIYFCHMLVNTYIAKIITRIIGETAAAEAGAVESIQGTALFIAAIVELPAMFSCSKLIEKFGVNKLMVFAAIVYSIKHILILICPNVICLYAVMVLQMLSYAIILPSTVYFANEIVGEEDRNKGQATFGIALTVGGLLASLIGGQLFQYTTIGNVLLIGVIFSCIGSALMVIGIRRLEA
ncbi:MAG: MFS transporter [Solobacterium sp.]|nr:MFS transporter [Solobacterium sp.]